MENSSINKESSTICFDSGNELKIKGMEQSLDHANEVVPKWSETAYNFLKEYAKTHRMFMVEEIRVDSVGKIPEPPSQRAWGSIISKAKRNKIVEHIGYNQVKNPRAHRANASVWQSNIYEQLF